MKILIRQSLFLVLFWFIVFLACRLSFYLCVIPLLDDVSSGLIFQSLYKGLRLDLSMIGYLISFPLLLFTVFYFTKKQLFIRLANLINYLFILIYVLAAVGEACLYREWKSKLSMQALQHFMHPSEVFKTTSWGLTVLFFGLSILLTYVFIKLYNRKVAIVKGVLSETDTFIAKLGKGLLYFVLIIVFAGLSIRGGVQQIPIQSSDAFFCTSPIANDAAVNPLWNIAFSIVDYENHFKENPFKDFSQADADKIVSDLYKLEKDSTIQFLDNTRPNIVFIIMESWSAYVSKKFGGDDFAPFIDSIANEGIAFTKIYPPAYVSDQGIPAVLSGYPAVSRISIINQSSKSMKLNCINQDLKKYGYQSGFIFGGDLNYGNIKSYIFNKEFDVVKEEKDIDGSLTRGKLGIQDEDMQKVYLNYLNQAKQPFLYSWFTLSSHMPYDFKGEKKALVPHKENDYINSIVYADNSFRNFFKEASKQAWYKNTLFVIVADHSHATHKDFSVYDAEYHRIPLLFFGDVIKKEWRGKTVEAVYSQMDIPATLLNQMGLKQEAAQYKWSKDMFNPNSKHFAYFCSFAGGGMVVDSGSVGYQHGLDELVVNRTSNNKLADSLKQLGKAYQQSVYEDYRLK
ncbi:MAG: sulfatase-like hydrolase/transferase [Bacteroidetes bacterium]|nr:sulfatase-like hydrolase/transferase [Bacteroidota bacterium]